MTDSVNSFFFSLICPMLLVIDKDKKVYVFKVLSKYLLHILRHPFFIIIVNNVNCKIKIFL
jgi:hypothetical protein